MNNDKPLAGIVLSLRSTMMRNSAVRQSIARAETDADGNYEFTGIAAGGYTIIPLAPLYVLPGVNESGKSVSLNDGESLTHIDLTLVRGGVITGRITDPEGRPALGKFVQVERFDENNNQLGAGYLFNRMDSLRTDDRGVYRIYGMAPGRYRISSGTGEGSASVSMGEKNYQRTYHPDTTDAKKAQIIELTDGSEASNVDIRLSPPIKAFTVSGRAIDVETGEPVANLLIGYTVSMSDGRWVSGSVAGATSPNGEFYLDGLRSGRYGVYAGGSGIVAAYQSNDNDRRFNAGYSDLTPVEVIDKDISGVELRVQRGGSLSGLIVIEGTTNPSVLARLRDVSFFVSIHSDRIRAPGTTVLPGSDGRFRLDGVRPGRVGFTGKEHQWDGERLMLVRIERDGVEQRDGIEIGPGEQISGVRLVYLYGNGVVRGQVNIVNGALPEGSYIQVSAVRNEGGREIGWASARADARGQFVIEGLAPGQYQIFAGIEFRLRPPPEFRGRVVTTRQSIIIASGQIQPLTLTLDLAQRESRQ